MARKGEFRVSRKKEKIIVEGNGRFVNRSYVLLLQIMEHKREDNIFPCDKKCGNFTV